MSGESRRPQEGDSFGRALIAGPPGWVICWADNPVDAWLGLGPCINLGADILVTAAEGK